MHYVWDYMDEIHKEEFKKIEAIDYYRDKKAKAISVANAIVLPYRKNKGEPTAGGGVADSEGKYIPESAQHIVGTEMDHGYQIEACEKKDICVMWFGAWHKHWGHFLTEMVSRCWYLIDHKPEKEDFYVAYSIKNDTTHEAMGGTFKEFLNLMGVSDERIILVEKPTEFKEVVIPELSCEPGRWYTEEYKKIFQYLVDKSEKDSQYEKVYLTRLKSRGLAKTQMGEQDIMKVFKENGYKIVAPERLSLTEQIKVYASCKKLVVVEGTLMHNVLFCQEHIDFAIINRVVGVNAYQPLIHQAKEPNVTYIDAHLSFFPVFAGGPFLFYFSDEFCKYCESERLSYKKKRAGMLKLHLKVWWYFWTYLENMTSDVIDRWKLAEKYQTGVVEQYAYYRRKLKGYNDRTPQKIRTAMFILLKNFMGLS